MTGAMDGVCIFSTGTYPNNFATRQEPAGKALLVQFAGCRRPAAQHRREPFADRARHLLGGPVSGLPKTPHPLGEGGYRRQPGEGLRVYRFSLVICLAFS